MEGLANFSFVASGGANATVCDDEYHICSSFPMNVEDEFIYEHRLSVTFLKIIEVLYALVCVAGILGNTLVIAVVLCNAKMRTVTNWYLLNLAIADECFLIGIPFFLTTMNLNSWPFGDVACKVFLSTTSINQITSSLFLAIMSADRYVAVCHPISSPGFRSMRTPTAAKLVSLSAWLVALLLIVPVILHSGTHVIRDETIVCNILWPSYMSMTGMTAFTLYSFAFGFALPLAFIVVFYALIVRKLRMVGRRHASRQRRQSKETSKKSRRKVTRLVLTVIAVYILCWLPYWVIQIALIFTNPNQIPPTESSGGGDALNLVTVVASIFAGCLTYSNSAVNPILYAFLSDNFRKRFARIFSCLCECWVATKNAMSRWRGGKGQGPLTNFVSGHHHHHQVAHHQPLTDGKAVDGGDDEDEDDEDGDRGPDPSVAVTYTSACVSTVNDSSAGQILLMPLKSKHHVETTQV